MSTAPLRVLFLTRYPLSGASSRYRVHQYVKELEGLGIRCTVQCFMGEDLYRLSTQDGHLVRKVLLTGKAVLARLAVLRHWRDHDIIYMQRELFPFAPPIIERWLKKQGAVLLYDYDDALFIKKASRYNPIATWLRAPEKVLALFRLVDCVVAGNDWLRDAAKKEGAQAVTVEVAEDTRRIAMHAPHTNEKPVTIGWLGSPSTVKYMTIIQPVLARISAQYRDVRFVLVGGGEFSMHGVDWDHRPWSLQGELEALAQFDIGLMPLPDEEWSNGKSGGKARTYMAAGVVPVCTAIGYNLELIRHGETGYLCMTMSDWEESLTRLIVDSSLRQRIAVEARQVVEQRFSVEGQARKLADLFVAVLGKRGMKAGGQ